mmetsp:Transcript_54828/g.97580  ORF Transcript_54828/g.97580 Transcript_54828/m.97580 type:complete len:87 (-) Transcript_54828:350-610(-)
MIASRDPSFAPALMESFSWESRCQRMITRSYGQSGTCFISERLEEDCNKRVWCFVVMIVSFVKRGCTFIYLLSSSGFVLQVFNYVW